MSKFKVRGLQDSDLNFIRASWIKGIRNSNDFLKSMPGHKFNKTIVPHVENLIHTSSVNVVCLTDDEDVILGYCVYYGNCIHWIFVKSSWREMGIAKMMFPEGIKTCSHESKIGKTLRHKLNIRYEP